MVCSITGDFLCPTLGIIIYNPSNPATRTWWVGLIKITSLADSVIVSRNSWPDLDRNICEGSYDERGTAV